ncbi:MMPL family transporter [Haloplasma contractile]|uniref:Membrane lipoprotein n=1 Tax=Haloplasma contractile SSD-17B TaxID=1033810 RepID=F7PTS9_9MOLU|nr:MMPL family transporter [Haloplasma contractile]ERJ12242.1 membrane lipoprotein [Haloplasma contractile SSD-17B]
MYWLSKVIVEKKYLFMSLFFIACVASIFAMQRVKINHDLTKYLPEESRTTLALNKMEEEFGLNGVANLVIVDVTPDHAYELRDQLSDIEGVLHVAFESNEDYYKKGNALLKITLDEGDYSQLTKTAIHQIKDELQGYEIEMSGSSVAKVEEQDYVEREMAIIMAIAIPIIIIILFINANSYAEIIVFGIVVGASVIINRGTNLFLGEISSVTNSIAIVLQLALAMDYSIILLHRFEEEKRDRPANQAIIHALKNSITSISASSLTTIFGLIAIMFMKFTIGYDIGIVLAKSIVCSLLSVFLLMPGILLVFNKLIEKTKHRTFIPDMKFIHKYVLKTRFFMPIVIVALVAFAFTLQRQNTFQFALDNEVELKYMQEFGEADHTVVLLIPKGDRQAEQEIISYMERKPYVNSVNGIETLGIRNAYSYTEYAEVMGVESSQAMGIYGYYLNQNDETLGPIKLSSIVSFMNDYKEGLHLSNEQAEMVTQLDSIIKLNNKPVSYESLALLLGLTEDEVKTIYTLYELNNNQLTYKMTDVLNFMINQAPILEIPEDEVIKLEQTKQLIDIKETELNPSNYANLLGITDEAATAIYTLYEMGLDEQSFGITDVFEFMIQNQTNLGLNDEQVTELHGTDQILQYKTQQLTSTEFSAIMGLTTEEATALYNLYNQEHQTTNTTIEFQTMIHYMVDRQNTLNLTEEQTSQLNRVNLLLYNEPLTPSEFSTTTGISFNQSVGIYAAYAEATNYEVTSYQTKTMLEFMYTSKELLNIDETTSTQLESVLNLYSVSNTPINSQTFANTLGLEENESLGIYGAYASSTGYTPQSIKLNDTINFILNKAEMLNLNEQQRTELSSTKQLLAMSDSELDVTTFSSLLKLDETNTELLYATYTVSEENPRYSLIQLVRFMDEHAEAFGLNNEQKEQIKENKQLMTSAINQFESDDYARIMFNINLKDDAPEALELVNELRTDLSEYYDDGSYYILGNSANILDIKDSFNEDVLIVNAITIISILFILIISFRSIMIPLLLVLVIQGSIWINFSISTLTDTPIIFIGYIIVTAIQMGATIDYAIVVTGRYKGFRESYNRYDAVKKAIHVSLPTVLTSGGILIVSGFSIGFVSSVSSTAALGTLIGRGALISCILVIFFLPQLLILFDRIVCRKKKVKSH